MIGVLPLWIFNSKAELGDGLLFESYGREHDGKEIW